jgi:hypothetical protein
MHGLRGAFKRDQTCIVIQFDAAYLHKVGVMPEAIPVAATVAECRKFIQWQPGLGRCRDRGQLHGEFPQRHGEPFAGLRARIGESSDDERDVECAHAGHRAQIRTSTPFPTIWRVTMSMFSERVMCSKFALFSGRGLHSVRSKAMS